MAVEPDTNGEKKDTRIKPGEVRNPAGRPKGARNKLGEAFVKALHEDFEQHGIAAVERVRDEKPDHYLKVIASLLPKEIEVGDNFASALKESRDAAVAAALRADE